MKVDFGEPPKCTHKPRCRTWVTRDKRSIKLCEMTTSHVGNALNYCRRLANYYSNIADSAFAYATEHDTMAAMYAEHAGDEAAEQAGNFAMWAWIFERELEKR